MDYLETWIISICTAVFFITAVEMILPKNSIKKYAKFALGLILITVIINPIIKFFDSQYDLEVYAKQANKYLSMDENKTDFAKYKQESIENSVGVFSDNLSNISINELTSIMPNNHFEIDIDVTYNEEISQFIINKVSVGASDSSIKKVKKIQINNTKEVNNSLDVSSEIVSKIKKSLSVLLNVSPEKIYVYKL